MTADQRPTSPGTTDPRVLLPDERIVLTVALAQDRRGGIDPNIATALASALERIAAADAADKDADPPWIRIRCDEETVELISEAIYNAKPAPSADVAVRAVRERFGPSSDDMARAVLAALAGEQHG